MSVFQFKAINPKFLSAREVRARILNVLKAEGKFYKKMLEQTTSSWNEHHPVFEVEIKFAKGDVFVSVTTDDKIWGYLNKGTYIRWAKMSHDWVSKTVPGQFSSGQGSGRVTIRGRSAMTRLNIPPSKGIEARNWTIILRQDNADKFRREIRKAVVGGLRARQNKP